MPYDSERHDRRSIRLEGWNYSWPGLYFVTICTQKSRHLFGRVAGEAMRLNAFGTIADEEWRRTATIRDNVELDSYIIMPNHVHGIIAITRRGTARRAPTERQFGKPIAGSLSTIVRAYKAAVTKRINEHRGTPGAPVWQRNYYEHIVRTPRAHRMISAYIEDNPARWYLDRYNEDAIRQDPRARELWNVIT